MNIIEIVAAALGLAMDALAVSICCGLGNDKKQTVRTGLTCGIWFGGFQMLMPLLGYLIGTGFVDLIGRFSHIIAFVLLLLTGCNMIREALQEDDNSGKTATKGIRAMFILALATSIDALAVGVTFSCIKVDIFHDVSEVINVPAASLIIGIISFVMSFAGVKIGGTFGHRFGKWPDVAGGIILLLLGLKILIFH